MPDSGPHTAAIRLAPALLTPFWHTLFSIALSAPVATFGGCMVSCLGVHTCCPGFALAPGNPCANSAVAPHGANVLEGGRYCPIP